MVAVVLQVLATTGAKAHLEKVDVMAPHTELAATAPGAATSSATTPNKTTSPGVGSSGNKNGGSDGGATS
jgi:hypothetical protein